MVKCNWFFLHQIFDRLLASIGQDTLDALFWATTDKGKGRSYSEISVYFFVATVYVCILFNVY